MRIVLSDEEEILDPFTLETGFSMPPRTGDLIRFQQPCEDSDLDVINVTGIVTRVRWDYSGDDTPVCIVDYRA